MKKISVLLSVLLLAACGGEASIELPATCSISSEKVRTQLCPKHPIVIMCTNVEQTNPLPWAHCDGPDFTEGHQISGNGWCCDDPDLASLFAK